MLFYNPKSGGGKAERFALADEARARGIEPIELAAAPISSELVRDAVADGADGLAMAGGDGSQAVVAAIAAELDLPYACIPAGTRNHFALDLGVDRDDVVGALDAFVDGGERRVDLAEVNGRVFVNNVSLGLYAEAVQTHRLPRREAAHAPRHRARRARARGQRLDLRWTGPGGHEHHSGAAILVSNNRYRLGHGGRLRHAPADRRRAARDHGRSAPDGAAAADAAAATVARVDGARVRGRRPTTPCPPASTARR